MRDKIIGDQSLINKINYYVTFTISKDNLCLHCPN